MLIKSTALIFAALLIVFLAGVVLGADPTALHLQQMMQMPSAEFPLGADELGRDMLSRLSEGLLLSVSVAVIVLLLTSTIGITVGVLSAWYGKWLDIILMRITDVFLSFPGILIAISFAALAGPGISNVVLALGLMGWVTFARLSRVQTLAIKEQDYVRSAQLSGVPTWRIIALYILPNIAAPLIVEGVFVMSGAIIAEAGLSFLGIGIQAPAASLGSMLREGARYMLVAPHMVIVPGCVLMMVVLGLNLLGDNLRDYLDKRQKTP